MDQYDSSDDASTSDPVSSRTRPPADNVDRDREERLLRDRVRKRQKKKRVQAEENDLKRQLSELENKLTVLRGESIVRRGLTDRRRLQSNLVFEFEKAMLYQGLVSTPRQNSAMILDPREDAYVFHTVSPDTTLPPAVLRPIMAQQLAKLSPWVMEQLSRSTADNGAFSFVMDDGGQDIAFLEMRKFLVMHTSVDAAARGLFDAMTGEGSSLVRHGDNDHHVGWERFVRQVCPHELADDASLGTDCDVGTRSCRRDAKKSSAGRTRCRMVCL
ncbi:hypothetical protein, variant 1 [Aphanomyces astaci]|uniref:Uncharacterized protein n=1 Tax=Aphanomyces astaci TaxID=112090 RepID=W4HC45_APHAT|nr:hypothetical protein, variant 1 [Aphanomyces astaci]ETV88688.1 hypothetical protein, variant 1 [Aphanomyces astaci]|eukprot:XP_009821088.1 hypothetical protein, variant 1 [Aphanomyces astaci]